MSAAADRVRAWIKADPYGDNPAVPALGIALDALEAYEDVFAIVAIEDIADMLEGKVSP